MTPLASLCKWWEQINRLFHLFNQCSHTRLLVSTLFLIFMASYAVAFSGTVAGRTLQGIRN